jgi:hypothetical protein
MTFEQVVQLSEQVIKEFISDWQKTPFCWLQEIDIQVELTHRFRNRLPENYRNFSAKHDHERNKQNRFQRVTCEPYVKLPVNSWIHPDIVIWADQVEQKENYVNSGRYPIDLLCEIKYSFNENISGEGEDQKRLLASLESESRPQLAVQLVFIQKPSNSEDTVHKAILAGGRFIMYHIYLPRT